MAHNYVLRVTAGHSYDPSTHKVVPVNTPTPVDIQADHTSISLNVRIQNYRGLPLSSPSTSPYFSLPPYNTHQYSIAFTFTPSSDISGDDLVFGNDFDHPIRDRLPPGFGTAFRIVKWAVDPGLEADVYGDKPWLYGRFLSSIDALWFDGLKSEAGSPSGNKADESAKADDDGEEEEPKTFDEEIGIVVEEGGIGSGQVYRDEKGIPEDAAARKKFFLTEGNRKEFVFEAGKTIYANFGNGYLDFNEFKLRLPGFQLPIMSYWDGQPLRYVLKNRVDGTVYLVVLFTLYRKKDINEDGTIKEGVHLDEGMPLEEEEVEESGTDTDGEDQYESAEEGEKEEGKKETGGFRETSANDVD